MLKGGILQYSNATDGYPLDQILCGDNLELIRELPDRSVQLVITSPPYFQQRDYGGGMGNEACLEEYLDSLLSLFHCGEIAGLRMKIRGIHASAFGGREGGRKVQIEKNGFTLIRLRGNKLKRDAIKHPVESVKGIRHPAIYPVKIVEEFLHLLTRPGDVVLEPFIGSSSTAVACIELGRHFIGYDINPEYCRYAQNRVEAMVHEDASAVLGNSR